MTICDSFFQEKPVSSKYWSAKKEFYGKMQSHQEADFFVRDEKWMFENVHRLKMSGASRRNSDETALQECAAFERKRIARNAFAYGLNLFDVKTLFELTDEQLAEL